MELKWCNATYIHSDDDEVHYEQLPYHTPGVGFRNHFEQTDCLPDIKSRDDCLLDGEADQLNMLNIEVSFGERR